jgi:hypothetical protein
MHILRRCRIGGGLQIRSSPSLRPPCLARYTQANRGSIHTSARPRVREMAPYMSNGVSNGVSPPPSSIQASRDNGNILRQFSSASDSGPVETEFLIAGAGPAGASLACFLTSYGKVQILVIIVFRP